jgi:hypothetical protein
MRNIHKKVVEKYRIGDVMSNLEGHYGISHKKGLKGGYLHFKDGEEVAFDIKAPLVHGDDMEVLAEKIVGHNKGVTGGSKDSKEEILNKLCRPVVQPYEKGLAKKLTMGVFVISIGGLVLFSLLHLDAVTGFVVTDTLVDGGGWKVGVGLMIVIIGIFLFNMFKKKE